MTFQYCLFDMPSPSRHITPTARGPQAHSIIQPVAGRSTDLHDQSARQFQPWPTSVSNLILDVATQQTEHTQVIPTASVQNTASSMSVRAYNDLTEYHNWQVYRSLSPTIHPGWPPAMSSPLDDSAVNTIIINEDCSIEPKDIYEGHHTVIDRYIS